MEKSYWTFIERTQLLGLPAKIHSLQHSMSLKIPHPDSSHLVTAFLLYDITGLYPTLCWACLDSVGWIWISEAGWLGIRVKLNRSRSSESNCFVCVSTVFCRTFPFPGLSFRTPVFESIVSRKSFIRIRKGVTGKSRSDAQRHTHTLTVISRPVTRAGSTVWQCH